MLAAAIIQNVFHYLIIHHRYIRGAQFVLFQLIQVTDNYHLLIACTDKLTNNLMFLQKKKKNILLTCKLMHTWGRGRFRCSGWFKIVWLSNLRCVHCLAQPRCCSLMSRAQQHFAALLLRLLTKCKLIVEEHAVPHILKHINALPLIF